MKNTSPPLQSTVIFGLICGLSFMPLVLGLSHVIYWPKALNLTLWIYVAVYSILLTRWSSKSINQIIFPLLLILIAIFWVDSISLFIVLALGILSWIRSGICFPKNMGKKIVAEALLGLVAGSLVISLTPSSVLTWALAVWMLFLVQALYFVIFETNFIADEQIKRDPFEKAREQAENILSTEAHIY
jgi:hypothetical protein